MNTRGRILHGARWYDVGMWLSTGRNEGAFREHLLSFAALREGERVLDVGCGTGTLAIAAKRAVGERGEVIGIDASPEMIERARQKASQARIGVTFTNALAERLPFPAEGFDVVLATLMLHHLPPKTRLRALQEIRRVLKPEGRLFVAEYENSGERPAGILGIIHKNRHGHVKQQRLKEQLREAGFRVGVSENTGISGIHVTISGRDSVTDSDDVR